MMMKTKRRVVVELEVKTKDEKPGEGNIFVGERSS